MPQFDVPGWSVPSEPQPIKKRKRQTENVKNAPPAAPSLDKLVKKLKAPSVSKPRKTQRRALKSRNKGQDEDVRPETPREQKNEGRMRSDAPSPSPTLLTRLCKMESDPATELTSLQKGMRESLDGARFRWINEILYTTDSIDAQRMMKDDPTMFQEYHTGFRRQVESWPTNPVSHYISKFSSYPSKTVIVDLGCGEAALAKALIPSGMTVLSFDLVSDGAYVVEADICSRVPLPGSEGQVGMKGEGEGGVVDVVVCALSLMGTNWVQCIQEAWRILKPGGELHIAEVASRITKLPDFVSLISSIGFRSKSKDCKNTHFTLLEFKKISRKGRSETEWSDMLERGVVLKPCEYKRR